MSQLNYLQEVRIESFDLSDKQVEKILQTASASSVFLKSFTGSYNPTVFAQKWAVIYKTFCSSKKAEDIEVSVYKNSTSISCSQLKVPIKTKSVKHLIPSCFSPLKNQKLSLDYVFTYKKTEYNLRYFNAKWLLCVSEYDDLQTTLQLLKILNLTAEDSVINTLWGPFALKATECINKPFDMLIPWIRNHTNYIYGCEINVFCMKQDSIIKLIHEIGPTQHLSCSINFADKSIKMRCWNGSAVSVLSVIRRKFKSLISGMIIEIEFNEITENVKCRVEHVSCVWKNNKLVFEYPEKLEEQKQLLNFLIKLFLT